MRKKYVLLVQILMLVGLMTTTGPVLGHGHGHGHGHERPMKKGILLVAFGTTVPEAQAAFRNIEDKVKAAFPDIPIRWAYTSKIVRNKLAEQGQSPESPGVALARMADEDFTHVAVQSLHTIPGEEYHYLVKTVHSFAGLPKGMKKVLIGYPLLSTPDDMITATDALMAIIPKERRPDEAVVFMGHGTHHPANVYYPALQYYLSLKDPNVLVGTVEGGPSLEDVIAALKAKGIKKAYLMPFMSVAGDHALNDMAGEEDDSWKSVLTKEGIECVPMLKGTAEFDVVVDIWIDHLKAVLNHF
jgi:sirohydrochlorin cobaltochelatase